MDAWYDRGACRGSYGLMFPGRGEDSGPAKALCRTCPVRAECLEYAIAENEKHGVWGGLSERERRRIRSARAVEAGGHVWADRKKFIGTGTSRGRHIPAEKPEDAWMTEWMVVRVARLRQREAALAIPDDPLEAVSA